MLAHFSGYAGYTVRGHIQEEVTSGILPRKGLGKMNLAQFWETTLNPMSRVLLQATLMGDMVLTRRKDSRVDGELGWVGAQHAASLTVYDETKLVQQTEINLYT